MTVHCLHGTNTRIEFLDGSFPPCLHCASRLHTSRNFPHAASFSKHCGRASVTPTGKTNIKPQRLSPSKREYHPQVTKILYSGFQNCWSFFLRVKSAPKGQYIHCHQRTGQFEIVTTSLPLQLPDHSAWVICHVYTRLNNSYLFFSHSTLPPEI